MQTILIANPKGGSGKTTLATNIAGWLAGKRQRVALADTDPQRSSSEWLARRPALFPPIGGFAGELKKRELKDVAPDWLVIDSPAGLHGDALRHDIRRSDAMLVPVTPSAFDMAATRHFFEAIAEYKAVKEGGIAVGIVGMRVDARTRSAAELDEFLAGYDYPVVAHLRDTQVYVYCARDGYSVFDLPRSRGEQDWEQWKPLTRWIARHAAVRNP
ncbi:MAG TPA: ParA family protein [Casimicrobiaceae bacterium]|nr:ParA family protein [Casimicrobiaceae bacterium]